MRDKIINMERIFSYISNNPEKGVEQARSGIRNIEKLLFETYTSPKYVTRKKQVGIEERRSLANKELYDLIEKEKRLPSVDEFTQSYLSKNAHFMDLPHEEFLANLAYRSLVTDIYFYFVLLKADLFTTVEVKYIYDLYAQTDILLSLDHNVLGVQLYAGMDIELKNRRLQYLHNNLNSSYPIYLLALEENKSQRKKFRTKSNDEILLYGEKDAEMLYTIMEKDLKSSQNKAVIEKMEKEALNADVDLFDYKRSPKKQADDNNSCQGIFNKVKHSLLIMGKGNVTSLTKEFKQKAECCGINLHLLDVPNKQLPDNLQKLPRVIDGKIDGASLEKLKRLGRNANCNIFQYEVEHFSPKNDLIVSAGAGSGKTHTLISRTLFLLNKGYVQSLKEIAMITFTKEAADNMRKALANRFIQLFKETNDEKYRHYLEELQGMQIDTIPAFAKHILQNFAHHMGLGSKIDISYLTMEKREIIENELDVLVKKLDSNLDSFQNMRQYDLMGLIESVWEKIEQKGIEPREIKISNQEEDKLYQIIIQTLQKTEEEIYKVKLETNKITLSDLTRLLKKLIEKKAPLNQLNSYYKYLFIDEFQDTDNAQIDFISEIALQSQIPLLVVGDIKQSIYRFRGATATAFDLLKTKLEEGKRTVEWTSLAHNYRTGSSLLYQMEEKFNVWRTYDWLPKNEESMLAKVKRQSPFKQYYQVYKKEIEGEEIHQRFKEMPNYSTRKSEEPNVMAILVRRNADAKEIGELLQGINETKNDEDFIYDVQLEGTLYESKAAKDLLILLESWLKPKNKVTLFALSETPYCKNEEQINLIDKVTYKLNVAKLPIHLPVAWHQAIEKMKYNPILPVVNEFLMQVPYLSNLAIMKNVSVDHFSLKKYQLNLYKILMQMYASVGDDYVDLLTLYNWIKIQVATNRDEDEVNLTTADVSKKMIKVMTVHKSKGLEFNTVLIPYTSNNFLGKEVNLPSSTDQPFDYSQFDYYIKKEIYRPFKNIIVHFNNNRPYIDWLFVRYNREYQFNHFTKNYEKVDAKEKNETLREETRILYVAMTRAEERLFIYGTKGNNRNSGDQPSCWADLLKIEVKGK
ncbi:UvrD-helicase domain-containing protein [Aquibacillus rhizosphaerae]|uniref:DNA 3'-5' helicase n=1 Tax=Aquibacillus rhizosphaerae TaxID=3051431 RepID=A0ABT7LB40_9BACI|nr:UvrD-helicase domain-containing protein [Aquibacillus sp. LR5S19]MDL4842467.1 UvrD-helicase domain-containing protein [Aquibacillus sp. LR5S19]